MKKHAYWKKIIKPICGLSVFMGLGFLLSGVNFIDRSEKLPNTKKKGLKNGLRDFNANDNVNLTDGVFSYVKQYDLKKSDADQSDDDRENIWYQYYYDLQSLGNSGDSFHLSSENIDISRIGKAGEGGIYLSFINESNNFQGDKSSLLRRWANKLYETFHVVGSDQIVIPYEYNRMLSEASPAQAAKFPELHGASDAPLINTVNFTNEFSKNQFPYYTLTVRDDAGTYVANNNKFQNPKSVILFSLVPTKTIQVTGTFTKTLVDSSYTDTSLNNKYSENDVINNVVKYMIQLLRLKDHYTANINSQLENARTTYEQRRAEFFSTPFNDAQYDEKRTAYWQAYDAYNIEKSNHEEPKKNDPNGKAFRWGGVISNNSDNNEDLEAGKELFSNLILKLLVEPLKASAAYTNDPNYVEQTSADWQSLITNFKPAD